MYLDLTGVKLTHDNLDSLLDERMVRTIASDEFFDNGPNRLWSQSVVWNQHCTSVPHT